MTIYTVHNGLGVNHTFNSKARAWAVARAMKSYTWATVRTTTPDGHTWVDHV
jgi:hypothetical protein